MTESRSKMPVGKQDRKVGQILLEQKIITTDQLASAIAQQHRLKAQGSAISKIGEILVIQKVISMTQLHDALRAQTHKADASRLSSVQAKKQQISQQQPPKKKEKKKSLFSIFGFSKDKK